MKIDYEGIALANSKKSQQFEVTRKDIFLALAKQVPGSEGKKVCRNVDVTLTLRALERIGGHAKNIAGHVIFLMTARDVRHESLASIRAEVLASHPD